jgi:hypothetical protein
VVVLPLPKSFQEYWYEGKTTGYKWNGVEQDTTQRYKEEMPKGTQVLALRVGKYISVLGGMTYPGTAAEMVEPKRTVLPRIF